MRRFALALLLLAAQNAAANIHGLSIPTSAENLPVGTAITTTVTGSWTFLSSVKFVSSDRSRVIVDGELPAGAKSAPITIIALAPGSAEIVYTLYNFGRPPGSGSLATITVSAPAEPLPCIPPDLVRVPPSQSVAYGENTKFTVEHEGTPPFRYLWYRGSEPIATTDTNVLTLPLTATADYSVVVANGCGYVTSAKWRATVVYPRRRAR